MYAVLCPAAEVLTACQGKGYMSFLAASVSPSVAEGQSQRLCILQRRRVIVSVPKNAVVPSFCSPQPHPWHGSVHTA